MKNVAAQVTTTPLTTMNILFLAALSLSAISLAALNASAGQSEPVSSSQTEHVSPLACNAFALSPEVRKRHFEELGPALLKLKKSTRELPDGYEFELPADNETYQLLTEWAFQERLCCPIFRSDLFRHRKPSTCRLSPAMHLPCHRK